LFEGIKFGLSLAEHADAKIVFVQFAGYMENELSIELKLKLTAIRDGDHIAFMEVYELMHAKLFRFFLKKIFLHDTAKDLTQQSFIRLWQFRHTLSDHHPLEKQVFIIARSLLINHIKKEETQKKLRAAAGKDLVEVIAPLEEELTDRKLQVSAAIETLPPVRKRIIILKAIHGCSNKEIAQQLKISVKTVEDHVTKAFRHIRQVIALLILFFISR
jgi:RNA polymerase sigma factor (sigma-70 family)